MKKFSILFATVALLTITSSAFATFPATPTWANQAKVEVGQSHIKFTADTLKLVLKTQAGASSDTATIGSYSTTGELATSGGYTQGGLTLSSCTVSLSGTAANFTCAVATWTNTAALTFDAVELVDSTCTGCANANQVIALFPVIAFTSSSSGSFTVTLPPNALVISMDEAGMPVYSLNLLDTGGAGGVVLPSINTISGSNIGSAN